MNKLELTVQDKMIFRVLVTILLLICLRSCSAQHFEEDWTREISYGTTLLDSGKNVALDRNNGSVYIVGGNSNYGGGGNTNMFLKKYSFDGLFQWDKSFNNSNSAQDQGNDVALDNSGNVYVTGITNEQSGQTISNYGDIFLNKYSPNGTMIWSRQANSREKAIGNAVAVGAEGNSFVAGDVDGTLEGQTPFGGLDIVLMKYDPDGNRVWTKQVGSAKTDSSKDVAVDNNSGNIYVVGDTNGNLNGELNSAESNALLMKYDTNGHMLWTRLFGVHGNATGNGNAIDGTGNVYVTGTTSNESFKGNFLVKYSPNGDELWTRTFAIDASAVDVVTDDNGNVTVVTSDFNLLKYDSDGELILQWTLSDPISTDLYNNVNGIAVNYSNGDIYICGTNWYRTGYYNTYSDAFLTKYSSSSSSSANGIKHIFREMKRFLYFIFGK